MRRSSNLLWCVLYTHCRLPITIVLPNVYGMFYMLAFPGREVLKCLVG